MGVCKQCLCSLVGSLVDSACVVFTLHRNLLTVTTISYQTSGDSRRGKLKEEKKTAISASDRQKRAIGGGGGGGGDTNRCPSHPIKDSNGTPGAT